MLLRNFFLLALLGGTGVVGASFTWNLASERERTLERALGEARANVNKDLSFRRWVTRHGGVYVPVTADQQPVKWLAHVPGRDVQAEDGRLLTLLNPATAQRQVMDSYAKEFGIRGRLTALQATNPDNAPDAWERAQLEAFARGERSEVWEVIEEGGARTLRHLRAMRMEEGCNKCHAGLEIPVGGVRGALGVDLPLAAHDQHLALETRQLALSHGGIWLLGLLAVAWSARQARRSEAERAAHHQRYRAVFEQARDGIVLFDRTTRAVIDFNTVAHTQLGYPRDAFAALRLDDLEASASPDGHALDALGQQVWETFETRHRTRDGALRDMAVTLQTVALDDRSVLLASLRDITDHKQADDALRTERDRSRLYLDTVQSMVVALDRDGRITMINPFGCRLLGGRAADLVGRDWFTTCLPPTAHDTARAYFAQLMAGDCRPDEYFENEILTTDGQLRLVAWHNALLRDPDGQILGTLASGEDITARRAAEEAVRHLAFFDPLTGLPNRRLLVERLKKALGASAGGHGAVLFLGLDRFKHLNDTLGRDVGDRLLVETARRLRACVREQDSVARLGGDEFVVLLTGLGDDEAEAARRAEAVGAKIVAAVREPFELDIDSYRGTTSVGIATFRGERIGPEDVLKHADLALSQAKAAGRDRLCHFDPVMQARLMARATLETDLQRAVEHGDFVLHYQPQVDPSGRCFGVEALVRWNGPDGRATLAPHTFIPVAEETGLIVPLGAWVLREACGRLAAWRHDPLTSRLTVAVNVSARQFREDAFVELVRRTLEEFDVAPGRLELEITESMLLDDVEGTVRRMGTLRGLGVSFSLDDFGTGYSSLAYVKRLPLEQLKIDRSFVRDVLSNPGDAAICRAIVALGSTLGMKTLAEGVETEGQWSFLISAGCAGAQGYLHARPMPEDALLDWLRKNARTNGQARRGAPSGPQARDAAQIG